MSQMNGQNNSFRAKCQIRSLYFSQNKNPKISSNARNNDSGHLELVLGGSDGGHRVDVVVGVADEASHRRLHDAHERVVSLFLA